MERYEVIPAAPGWYLLHYTDRTVIASAMVGWCITAADNLPVTVAGIQWDAHRGDGALFHEPTGIFHAWSDSDVQCDGLPCFIDSDCDLVGCPGRLYLAVRGI